MNKLNEFIKAYNLVMTNDSTFQRLKGKGFFGDSYTQICYIGSYVSASHLVLPTQKVTCVTLSRMVLAYWSNNECQSTIDIVFFLKPQEIFNKSDIYYPQTIEIKER